MSNVIHTSDIRFFDKLWRLNGGRIEAVRRTGECRYTNPAFRDSVRTNGRRKDVPAVLLSRLNTLVRLKAANDCASSK
ncbi:hypothetical protein PQR39_36340 [Paraburkholderia sediminicola]|uniref:hypothetical protein n=1 Tax=Paraburkholderia sediminicola TaxID=458836 RepID=UPI0038BE1DB0